MLFMCSLGFTDMYVQPSTDHDLSEIIDKITQKRLQGVYEYKVM